MPFIEWDDSMCLGVAELDDEHRRLVDILNELHAFLKTSPSHEKITRIIDQLVAYTAYHFMHEEKLFLGADYPGADFHIAEHRALTERVLDIQRNIRFGIQKGVPEELTRFLKEWLVHHTQGVDRGYVPYISKEKAEKEQAT